MAATFVFCSPAKGSSNLLALALKRFYAILPVNTGLLFPRLSQTFNTALIKDISRLSNGSGGSRGGEAFCAQVVPTCDCGPADDCAGKWSTVMGSA
jgi:hypothetical protein